MRVVFVLVFNLVVMLSRAQLTVSVLVPPSGMMDKQQLWNMVLSNTDPQPLTIQLQLNFSERVSGQPVFTATTMPFIISPGTQQVSIANLGNIHYDILNGDYRMDASPSGLLPVGSFNACYEFAITKPNKVVQECQPVVIPPLSPLLLNLPANGAMVQEPQPIFSWLPPSPVSSIANLRYEMLLVEILSSQSPADAIRDNIPVFNAKNVLASNLPYQQGAPALEPGKKYAWQVKAISNVSEINRSDTWSFTVAEKTTGPGRLRPDPVYIKLKKAGSQEGNAIFWGDIRVDYLNTTADTAWHISIEDLSIPQSSSFTIPTQSIKLTRGQNLLAYPATDDRRFIDKHQYLLKVTDSKNEIWQIRFEYRK